MNLDYNELPNIRLEELSVLANYENDTVYNYLIQNDIHTLRELFRVYDSNTIFLGNCTKPIRERIEGIIDLLRCQYLQEPLKVAIYYGMPAYLDLGYRIILNPDISFDRMGFTKLEKEKFNFDLRNGFSIIELFYITKENIIQFLSSYKYSDKKTLNYYRGFLAKINILISYYEKICYQQNETIKSQTEMNPELERIIKLRNLYKSLKELNEARATLDNQILKIEEEIQAIIHPEIKTKDSKNSF